MIHSVVLKYSLSVGLICFLLTGCVRHSSDSHYESITEISESMYDSPTVDSDKEEEEPEEVHFTTAEQIDDWIDSSSYADMYRQGVIPAIAACSPEYASRLINNRHDGFIIVDKDKMTVALYDRFGRQRRNYGMACARNYGTKHKKADSRTPEGFFYVEGVYDSTEWLFTDDWGKTSKVKGQFGPRFIRLKIPNTSQIGIHGTGAPWSIGHRVSHGCIRITNENIMELHKLVSPGMPVIVSPGSRDQAVNRKEGYKIVKINLSGKPERIPEEVFPEKKDGNIYAVKDSNFAIPDSVAGELPLNDSVR